jgi:hypothetical protein
MVPVRVKQFVRAAVPLWVAVMVLASTRPASMHNPITTTVLYNREIAAILNQKCVQCHVAEGMAMPLQSYNEVRPWAVAIKEEVLGRHMPPWSAERGYGAFANDVSLTPREQEFLISWIDGGVPEGDGEAPPHIDHSSHWMLGQPDAIVTATRDTAGTAPPGVVRYIVDPGLKREAWLRGFDFKPGDKRASRAAFLSVAASGEYIGGWTPWSPWFSSASAFPEGAAFRLPAGATIAIDVLSGDATASAGEPPRLGLYFATAAAERVTNIVLAGDKPTADGRVRAELPLAADQTLLGMRVDLSAGATSLELKAIRPDGSFEPLLWVREFRRDWQTPYVLRSPVSLPRGSIVIASAVFDKPQAQPQVRITLNAIATRTSTTTKRG